MTDAATARRFADLEARITGIQRQLDQQTNRPPVMGFPRDRWLGVTVANGQTYPETGNTFFIKLISAAFAPEVPGDSTVTQRDRGTIVLARTWPEVYLAEGTEVVVDRIKGVGDGGSWWVNTSSSTPQIRWGRTTAVAASYTDLSYSRGAVRSLPIYEVELGDVSYDWPTDLSVHLGWSWLDTAINQIDQDVTAYVPKSPSQVVLAGSLIGDLHQGQPVLLASESGKWWIIGPQQAQVSTEEVVFAPRGWTSSSTSQSHAIFGEQLALEANAMYGTGGNGGWSPNWHDVVLLPQSGHGDPFARINRRGDYMIRIAWWPQPYRLGYLRGYYDASEAQTLTGATVTSSSSSGHTHTVDVKNQLDLYWQANLDLLATNSTYARSGDTVTRLSAIMRYADTQGHERESMFITSFNRGDELRLVLSISDIVYNDSRLTHRGAIINQATAPRVMFRRLGEANTYIP